MVAFALSSSLLVMTPGGGRLLLRPLLVTASLFVPVLLGEVGVLAEGTLLLGKLALLFLRRLCRLLGGSSETAFPKFPNLMVIVGFLAAGGVAALRFRPEVVARGEDETPAGANGIFEVVGALPEGPVSLSLLMGFVLASGDFGFAVLDEPAAGVASRLRFLWFSGDASNDLLSEGTSMPCSRASCACRACSSKTRCFFSFLASLSRMPRLISSASASSSSA